MTKAKEKEKKIFFMMHVLGFKRSFYVGH